MTRIAALILALMLIAPAAHAKDLNGEYLLQSCRIFNHGGTLKFKDKADGFDKGVDAGFCSGFLLGLLTNKTSFCPPKDTPVTAVSKIITDELSNHPPQRLAEPGAGLALEILKKTYPCN